MRSAFSYIGSRGLSTLPMISSAVHGDLSVTPEELDSRDAKELEALDKARPILLADTHVVYAGDVDDLRQSLTDALDTAS